MRYLDECLFVDDILQIGDSSKEVNVTITLIENFVIVRLTYFHI